MKVFFPIGAYYPAQTGGPSNSLYWLVSALIMNQVHCIISTTDEGISSVEHNIDLNRWIETESATVRYQKTYMHYFPIGAFICQIGKLRSSDIIHLSDLYYPLSFMTALLNRILWCKPIVWSVRGELERNALVYSYRKKRVVLFLIRKLLSRNTCFHSTSDVETLNVKKVFGSDVKVVQIPNYIKLESPLNISKAKYLLYLGRIHPIKGLDNLIVSLNLCSHFIKSDYILKIAGDLNNSYAKKMIIMVEEMNLCHKIIFLGHIEGLEKQELLSKAKFSLFPSHSENFGNVVIESLAQGTPVIASIGTPWSRLVKCKAGFWVNNSPESFAKCIGNFLTMNDNEYKMYCKNSVLLAKEYDVNLNIEKWLSVYQSLSQ